MSNRIELRHLRYFLAVAKELHFGKAAEKLFISQPGLSRQIKQMEAELDVQLFIRSNKKVHLTDAGNYLKDEVNLNLKNLDNVLQYTKLIDKGIMGKIRLGYVGSAMQNVIPKLLMDVRKTNSNIQFNLKEMEIPKQISSLLSQEIDVGFLRMKRVPGSLKVRKVMEEYFSLVLPSDHPLNQSNFIDISQLRDEPFIFIERNYSPEYFDKIMSIFNMYDFEPIISHTSVHANTIFKMVENKLGAAIVPTSLTKGFDIDVKFIELKNIPQRTTLSIAYNSKNRNPLLPTILKYLD